MTNCKVGGGSRNRTISRSAAHCAAVEFASRDYLRRSACGPARPAPCCTAIARVLAKPRFRRGSGSFPVGPAKSEFPLGFQWFAPPFRGRRQACGLQTTSTGPAMAEQAQAPTVSGMAGRYATALFELALEEKKLDAVKADLDRFDALIDGNPDLDRLVRSPVFSADEQTKALDAMLEEGRHRRYRRQFPQRGRRATGACSRVRDMIKGFPQAGRAAQGRSHRRSDRRREALRHATQRAERRAQIGDRQGR